MRNKDRIPPQFLPKYDRKERDWSKYIAFGDPSDSFYLPWNDFFDTVCRDVRFESAQPQIQPPDSGVGQALRQVRRIQGASVGEIEDFAADVRSRPVAFVSYRWRDGTHFALKVVEWLWRQGWAAWWDRCSLPRHVAEGNHQLDPDALGRALEQELRACKHAVVVRTPGYAAGTWTQLEEEVIQELAASGELRYREVEAPGRGSSSSAVAEAWRRAEASLGEVVAL